MTGMRSSPGTTQLLRAAGLQMAWGELLEVSGPESRAMVWGRQGSAPRVLSMP